MRASRRSWLLFGAALLGTAGCACRGGPPTPVTQSAPSAWEGPGSVIPAGRKMSLPRAAHSATLLPDGRVLVAGGCVEESCEMSDGSRTAEIFDPRAGTFTPAASLSVDRASHTATHLPGGRVLIAGGWARAGVQSSTEIYDPAAGAFAPGPAMAVPRSGHSATRLEDGRVLVAGGYDGRAHLDSAEIFDPRSGGFEPASRLTVPRSAHAAALLKDGRVLLTGGTGARGQVHAAAEVFDPARGSSSAAGDMTAPRYKHAAVSLLDGRVLVLGGSDERDGFGQHASAEIYDPASGGFEPAAGMRTARFKIGDAVVLLPDGRVLVAGGGERAELYDPAGASFEEVAGDLGGARAFSTATHLGDGSVLIAGGYDRDIHLTDGAWIFRPRRP